MTKRSYDVLTTISLLGIATAAILSDRIPRFGWLFGAIAISCALVSTGIYFKFGMKASRKPVNKDGDSASPALVRERPAAQSTSMQTEHAELLDFSRISLFYSGIYNLEATKEWLRRSEQRRLEIKE